MNLFEQPDLQIEKRPKHSIYSVLASYSKATFYLAKEIILAGDVLI